MTTPQDCGLFPKSYKHFPSDVVARHFFSASTKAALPDHSAAGGTRLVLRGVREGAKYKRVRGRSINAKLDVWPPSETYRPTEEDCQYRREFHPHPLDNFPADRELYTLWRATGRGGEVPPSVGLPLGCETAQRAAYPRRSGPQPLPPESLRPERDEPRREALLEVESASRKQFAAPRRDLAERMRAVPCAPHANGSPLPAPCEAGPFTSSLRRAHSTSVLVDGPAPTHWRASKRRPLHGPPPGEHW